MLGVAGGERKEKKEKERAREKQRDPSALQRQQYPGLWSSPSAGPQALAPQLLPPSLCSGRTLKAGARWR